jgi:hypothetical protein
LLISDVDLDDAESDVELWHRERHQPPGERTLVVLIDRVTAG